MTGTAYAGEVAHSLSGHAQNPVWSPKGKFLAFEVNELSSGSIKLFVAPMRGSIADSSMTVKLPGMSGPFATKQSMVNSTWHPQGLLIFAGSNEEGKYRVYFTQPPKIAAAELITKSLAPGDLSFPAVSGDAKMVAFVSDQSGDGDVRVYDASKGAVVQATDTGGAEVYPAFTADNKHIIYNRKVNMHLDIYKTNLETKESSRLIGGSGDQSRPIVTVAGDVVYFAATSSEGPWNIVKADANGENKQILARGIRLPYSARPAVSPDGKWVAFTYDNPVKANSVYLAAIDGSQVKEIKTDFRACGEPAIGTQDGRIMLAYTAIPSGEADWRMLQVVDISQHF
jgi:Tol biopolymer transport system component